MNRANAILSIEDVQKGTIDQTAVYPREIIKRAFEIDACGIIFVHNHPSGKLEPSRFDLEITGKLVSCCRIVGISPLDHIIVSPEGYISLREKGLIKG